MLIFEIIDLLEARLSFWTKPQSEYNSESKEIQEIRLLATIKDILDFLK